MNTNNDHRQFDIIVWGATGFTGRLVAEYLLSRYGCDGPLKWAIGGRNPAKLETVRAELGTAAANLPIVTGSSGDTDSMNALAAQTSVICTTVGPYAKYGSELVAACVRNGTHYCDLAGEPQWMRKMIDAHQAEAEQSGARIVHTCGFDSIPSDIGVFFLQREAIKLHGKPCQHIKLRVKAMKGGASGGTVASMMNAIVEGQRDRAVARTMVNPYGLNPDPSYRGPDRRDQTGWLYDDDLDAWTAPFVMAVINTKVVRRTNALLDFAYGEDFRYEEATLAGSGAAGWAKASATTLGLGGFMLFGSWSPTRSLLNKYVLPKPGEGPDKNARENGFFNLLLIGKLDDGSILRARVKGDRDPGYGSTCKMLGESAVCLAQDVDDIKVGGGFWTPASAMGEPLLRRMTSNAGLSFEMEAGLT